MKFKTKHTIDFANSANEKEENEYLCVILHFHMHADGRR